MGPSISRTRVDERVVHERHRGSGGREGNYQLEAIVGDARHRNEINGIRLYIEGRIGDFRCWHRDVDLAYMYLYQPDRKPQRQFNYDFMLRGPDGVSVGLQPGLDKDECFHRNLAVKLEGRVMCNGSVPMANASVLLAVNTTSEEPRLVVIGRLDNEGRYERPAIFGDVASRSEIQALTLMVTNICDGMKAPANSCTKIPLNCLYAYDYEDDTARKFVFHILMDDTGQTCE